LSRDGDLARLHSLRDAPNQLDVRQPVVVRRPIHLHVIGQVELALELLGRDAAIDVLSGPLPGFTRGNRQKVLVSRDGDVAGGETSYRKRDAVAVLAGSRDVVGRSLRGLPDPLRSR
jgi:hypothetical protein